MFLAVDGVDGAGKTTLVRQLAELLGPFDPIITKEPTDLSHWGQLLREAAVTGRLSHEKELEYFHKDRIHHIEHVILPNLKRGKVVISDRYVDSTLAFQAQTPEEADVLYTRFVDDILVPDVSFILMCPVDLGLRRIKERNGKKGFSVYEKHEILTRAQKIYESREGDNYELIDASGTIENTFDQAVRALERRYSNQPRFAEILDEFKKKLRAFRGPEDPVAKIEVFRR